MKKISYKQFYFRISIFILSCVFSIYFLFFIMLDDNQFNSNVKLINTTDANLNINFLNDKTYYYGEFLDFTVEFPTDKINASVYFISLDFSSKNYKLAKKVDENLYRLILEPKDSEIKGFNLSFVLTNSSGQFKIIQEYGLTHFRRYEIPFEIFTLQAILSAIFVFIVVYSFLTSFFIQFRLFITKTNDKAYFKNYKEIFLFYEFLSFIYFFVSISFMGLLFIYSLVSNESILTLFIVLLIFFIVFVILTIVYYSYNLEIDRFKNFKFNLVLVFISYSFIVIMMFSQKNLFLIYIIFLFLLIYFVNIIFDFKFKDNFIPFIQKNKITIFSFLSLIFIGQFLQPIFYPQVISLNEEVSKIIYDDENKIFYKKIDAFVEIELPYYPIGFDSTSTNKVSIPINKNLNIIGYQPYFDGVGNDLFYSKSPNFNMYSNEVELYFKNDLKSRILNIDYYYFTRHNGIYGESFPLTIIENKNNLSNYKSILINNVDLPIHKYEFRVGYNDNFDGCSCLFTNRYGNFTSKIFKLRSSYYCDLDLIQPREFIKINLVCN